MDVSDWLTYWEYALLVLVPASIVCGLFIGSLVGARVAWRPVRVSAAAAVVFVGWNWAAMSVEPVPHAGPIKLVNAVLLSLTVALAAVVTTRRARHV